MTKLQNTKPEEVEPGSRHRFNFGKYKGRTWNEVSVENPNYIHWCIRNVAWFHIPEGCQIPRYQKRVWIIDDDYWDDDDGWGCNAGEWDW